MGFVHLRINIQIVCVPKIARNAYLNGVIFEIKVDFDGTNAEFGRTDRRFLEVSVKGEHLLVKRHPRRARLTLSHWWQLRAIFAFLPGKGSTAYAGFRLSHPDSAVAMAGFGVVEVVRLNTGFQSKPEQSNISNSPY